MSWNYRVVRKVYKTLTNEDEEQFGIHEVYYDDLGNANAVSMEPVTVAAESPEGVKWVLKKMKEALKKPVIDYEKFDKD